VRRPLSRARIIRAALEVIDREGLEALTMRRVAARLGVEAMSLYHHVPSKDAILEGVFDLAVAEAELPKGEVSAADWIRGSAEAFRRLVRDHPRAFPLFTSRPVPLVDVAAAQPMEDGLAAFARLGMTPESAFAAVQAVSLAMLAVGLLESRVALEPHPDVVTKLAELPVDRFPLLSAVLELDIDPELIWSSLVDALVRGLGEPESA